MARYITELANDIAKSCPDLVENGCGNDNCVACLAFKLIGLGYKKQPNTADVVPKSEVARDFDDLKRYIILNENIAIKCKRENGEQNEEYWKGKISAFKQIRAYIDAELKKKYTESEDK